MRIRWLALSFLASLTIWALFICAMAKFAAALLK